MKVIWETKELHNVSAEKLIGICHSRLQLKAMENFHICLRPVSFRAAAWLTAPGFQQPCQYLF
jgi:hypothetical protein